MTDELWVPPGTREKIKQEKCDHHWHLNPDGEIKTSNPPWWPVTCCRCKATNHILTDEPHCGKRGPRITGRLLSPRYYEH